MTTNKINFISKLFVVLIVYLEITIIMNFNTIDLLYLLFVIGSFIKYQYINKEE